MTVNFLFLLSPNNSGSTIVGQYIEAQTGGYLPPFGNFEGQMVPSVRKEMRPDHWNPDKHLDWGKIREAWSSLAESENKDLFIECSPPNILRLDAIRPAFAGVASYLFSISSPYSFVASTIYNYERAPLTRAKLQARVRQWVFRAQWMKRNVAKHRDVPLIRYEDFCARPAVVNDAIGVETRPVSDMPGKANDPIREIIDLTPRHLAFMTFSEWDAVNEALIDSADLLAFFDYGMLPGQALIEQAFEKPALVHAGQIRRLRWESRSMRRAALRPAARRSRL